MNIFSTVFKVSLQFFLKFPYIFSKTTLRDVFINYTNLSKFVKIFFDTYLNFIKLSNISKIFWKASTKFQQAFCRLYTNFIHNLPTFFKNFLKDFQNFHKAFPNIPLISFQNFNKHRAHQSTLTHLNCFLHGNTDRYSTMLTSYGKPLLHNFVTNSWSVTMATYSAEHLAFIVDSYMKHWDFLIWQHWSYLLNL